jgi:ubiquinone/menaquinone biosynthesis C-methylase UbiE
MVNKRDWNHYKREHLKLSSAVAELYDSNYQKSNFATASYMQYELDNLTSFIEDLPDYKLAIDLGCGTGRGTFLLANHFKRVVGYDFSSEMIAIAENRKTTYNVSNIEFKVEDIEKDKWLKESSNADYVTTSFGMGSFVKDLIKLLERVDQILKPGGRALFSFYNKDSLNSTIDHKWQPAITSKIITGKDILEVKFDTITYNVSAKAYSVSEVRNILSQYFLVKQITTYPTLSSLFPKEYFDNEKLLQLCKKADQIFSTDLELAAGPFIFTACEKK